ncbi:sperm-tail PG-rich repeat-containing protein 2-like [Osmia bicornis bicornis]|uniref:sperm-tail PG-rich repeat-containing protein 2-like n=1 Tax=Osmia bicornis bicornis TaxID=1437191 RepID=UPI001EAEE54A|nr:sperm-tail PG-rich repeat-containing protein 2-like [Osmia bicornis bicornis]
MTTLLYKGNFWSRMSGRSAPPPSLTPGPGNYEYETKKTATELQNEKIREAKRMSTRQLRSLDIIYRRTIRENLPAPNCYHVKGSFDRFLKSSCKCDPYALEPPPFGRTAKRFDDKNQSDIPGPGTYDPQDQIKCIGSLYFPPFGAYANRFKKESENNEPAPCDYHSNVGNLAYESQKRFKYSYSSPTQHFFFNQMSSFQNEDYCIPNFVEKNQVEKHAVYHAAFKSRTNRFPKAQKDREIALTRSLKVRASSHDPTYYEVAGDISMGVKGGAMSLASSADEKFRKSVPGPSHYCIHPYLSSSILKKTFNVKLGKPKVIAEMMKQEEPGTKVHCPCKRKKLRWFAMGPKAYQHCDTVCINKETLIDKMF